MADQINLQFAGRFDEANPHSQDVPTRITYAFDVIFPTMGGFTGWLDHRDVVLNFVLGPHACQTHIRLSKSPNPYMIDVDPATHNPAWLSTDVRVFKVRPNEPKFGATLAMSGNGPWTYIRAVLDNLRTGAVTSPRSRGGARDGARRRLYERLAGHCPASTLPSPGSAIARR